MSWQKAADTAAATVVGTPPAPVAGATATTSVPGGAPTPTPSLNSAPPPHAVTARTTTTARADIDSRVDRTDRAYRDGRCGRGHIDGNAPPTATLRRTAGARGRFSAPGAVSGSSRTGFSKP